MRLRAPSYLSDAGNRARVKRRTWAGWLPPTWVLPRAWCVTASLQAKGVPRHKVAAFAQLHLSRLAPFADSGVFACRAGDWVHFWFWENQRVRELCQEHGLDMATLKLVPESVCFPHIDEGAVLYRGAEGVEAQLWHNGRLLDSAWWPQAPDLAAWQAWRPTAAASASPAMPTAWPESPPLFGAAALGSQTPIELNQPWAANLLGEKWTAGLRELRSGTLFILCAGLLVGFAAYWSVQWLLLQRMQSDVEQQIAALSERVEPLNAARAKALHLLQWSGQVARLYQHDDIHQILKTLQPVLEKQNAALREFEYHDGEVRLMVVPVSGDIDLALLIQRIEALDNLRDLRLLPDSDARLVRVSAKIREIPSAARGSATVSPTSMKGTVANPLPAAGSAMPSAGSQ